MHSHFIQENLCYTGEQLSSHWIEKQSRLSGDAIVAFCGEANVGSEHMVDLEDLAAKAWIKSDLMLHFLVEHFDFNLREAILGQRLLASIVAEEIHKSVGRNCLKRERNDIYDGDKKLSVSIATSSPVSTLIHLGVNVTNSGTPLPTCALEDYDIDPAFFARSVMDRYVNEIDSLVRDSQKVRSVS